VNRVLRNQVPRHFAVILLVFAGLLGAAGCVNVPTTGPIDKVEGQQPGCQNCVNVVVAPPAAGDKPIDIVEGYLRATSNYQPNYSVAKQFLSQMAAEKWSPETGVLVFRGAPMATAPETVTLEGDLVGQLEADRTYVARDTALKFDFHLVQENGEWRINTVPPGLMVAEYSFTSFYQPYDLYFVGNGSSLVPDHIYLPALSNPANVASALMKALLKGPSNWLKPAVTTAIPPNTSLSVDSVTITDGIAEVPLSDSVLALADPQRDLLAAQIVYTLRQVGGVNSVVIKANQQPYRLRENDPTSLPISVDAIRPEIAPVPYISDQLYAVENGAVKRVRTTANTSETEPLEGPLGKGRHPVDALAVSMMDTDLAVTTDRRTTLRRAPITSGEPSTLLSGVTDLLRPQFTRYNEIWVIGRHGGRQRMWMATEKKRIEVEAAVFSRGSSVTASKISPDGTRMALVRRNTATGQEQLGIARIIRSDNKIIVNGWRALDTTQGTLPIGKIADVAWRDGTELLVLGAADAATAYTPYQVVADASRIAAEGEPAKWDAKDAKELAVLPGRQTAIIVARTGKTWKDDRSEWLPFLEGVSTIAYPG
jgi:hypothetical protein